MAGSTDPNEDRPTHRSILQRSDLLTTRNVIVAAVVIATLLGILVFTQGRRSTFTSGNNPTSVAEQLRSHGITCGTFEDARALVAPRDFEGNVVYPLPDQPAHVGHDYFCGLPDGYGVGVMTFVSTSERDAYLAGQSRSPVDEGWIVGPDWIITAGRMTEEPRLADIADALGADFRPGPAS